MLISCRGFNDTPNLQIRILAAYLIYDIIRLRNILQTGIECQQRTKIGRAGFDSGEQILRHENKASPIKPVLPVGSRHYLKGNLFPLIVLNLHTVSHCCFIMLICF